MHFANKTRGLVSVGRCSFAVAIGALGCGQTGLQASAEPDLASVGESLAFQGVMSAGDTHACIVARGWVKCWGDNTNGKLGLGNTLSRGDGPGEMGDSLPWVDLGQSTSHRRVTSVVAGAGHTCAILDDGSLKCWGANNFGQLGLGDTSARGNGPNEMGTQLPSVNLGTGRTAVSVTLGVNHTCALLDNAKVKCWGNSAFGQLGLGDVTTRGTSPTQMGDNLPYLNLGIPKPMAIAAGGYHTCALLESLSVRCWKRNSQGQLGNNTSSNRGDDPGEMGEGLGYVFTAPFGVKQVSAGLEHSCAVLTNNSVKCWGANSHGQLGQGNTVNRGGNPSEMEGLLAIELGFDIRMPDVSARRNHTCLRFTTGDASVFMRVKCWGNNSFGQLGRGDTQNRGDNANEMGLFLSPIDLTISPIAVAAGGDFTCANSSPGVKCWGNGANGVLGQGNTARLGDGPGEMGAALPDVPLGTPPDGGF